MIRPRSGNFVYNKKEIYQMEEEISFCKTNGVKEVVFGVLDTQNRIDMDLVKRLTNISYPMRVTFHKAIDCSDNIKEAFEQLIKCKAVTSVLTSGKGKFVLENRTLIKEIIQLYKDKINIILAGGITNDNLDKIHKTFHCIEYHGKKIVGKLC
jgi:copper homeostasis protein